eukprot:CAMPEP_0167756120 /NCGR_PEP_ID=MMETSP0110_2-20121227/9205_1 /TAXON_ID=629695 /ORGANISM="Gymnochlora sp., Strain CCMP2014" /LENGTH=247 /DNA_ID=CAMNT_0007642187 /DNA_START=481 /DNA_END=1224 /DNA_ORIENTATION=-
MVTAIAIGLRWEKATPYKILGIFIAFGGALFIVFWGANIKQGSEELAGNILYFFNCLGTALYIICAKPIFKYYPAMSITGWSYIVASIMMMVACLVGNNVESIYSFVCDDCPAGSKWRVPNNAIYALIYWILLTSVGSYLLMTWGNRYADASLVLAYTPLQPATSAVLSFILIQAGFTGKLTEPGINILGVIGIFIGLAFVIYDNRKNQRLQQEEREKREYTKVNDLAYDDSKADGEDEVFFEDDAI